MAAFDIYSTYPHSKAAASIPSAASIHPTSFHGREECICVSNVFDILFPLDHRTRREREREREREDGIGSTYVLLQLTAQVVRQRADDGAEVAGRRAGRAEQGRAGRAL